MPRATAIVNARVFDGTRLRDWTSVRFAGGVITDCAAGPAARDGDEVIDARGGTVLPGLIDSHIHLVPGALAQGLAFGVTTALDMFSLPGVAAAARRQAGARADVADVRSAGIGATAPGGHPSMLYGPFPTLAGPEEAGRFVADRAAEGSDYLKVFAPAGPRAMPSLDLATVTALAGAAHERGLAVVAHVSSVAGLRDAVSAGVDVIAHVPLDGEVDRALAGRVAEAGIAVGPTLATVEGVLGGPGAPPYSRAEENVGRLAAAGVTILAGTDAPGPGTVFGASLHRELELLGRCGIAPAGALSAATAAAARVFGLADRGRAAPGQRADLVLVSGDPLADITGTRAVSRIWRAGVPCARRPFVASAAEAEELAAFDARVARAAAAVRERRYGPGGVPGGQRP